MAKLIFIYTVTVHFDRLGFESLTLIGCLTAVGKVSFEGLSVKAAVWARQPAQGAHFANEPKQWMIIKQKQTTK